MVHDTRFEIRMPAQRRRELNELAAAVGLSSADLARMGIGWVVDRGDILLKLPTPAAQISASREQLAVGAHEIKKLSRKRAARLKAKDMTAVKRLDAEIAEVQRGATLTAQLIASLQGA
jgi:hypothetical protein